MDKAWYNDQGFKGPKDKQRSGRPSFVDENIIMKRRVLDSNTRGEFKQVMTEIIQKRTSANYDREHIQRFTLKIWFYNPDTLKKI